MAKLVLNDITSGYASVDTLNSNFTAIETALENTLSRDGTTPNSMSADLDMNGHRILNELAYTGDGFIWEGAWLTDTAYQINNLVQSNGNTYVCTTTHTSGAFATDLAAGKWELVAAKGQDGGGAGNLVAADNLSHVDLIPAIALSNLGGQPYDVTLTALAGTLTAANKIPYATALNTASELDWNASTALANSATTISSNTVVKTAIDELVANCASATPDNTADYFVFEDATDGVQKKALLSTIASSTLGTTKSYGLGTLSGTTADFTGIPTGTKQITLSISGLSTNGTSNFLVQLGDSGGVETTGYLGSAGIIQNAGSSVVTSFTTGFGTLSGSAGNVLHGTVILTLIDSATNLWAFSATTGWSSSAIVGHGGGSKALSGTLDRVRLTTVGGTDTFDAGLVNIIYT